ncbi:MAG: hypothetical protein ACYC1T_07160 [Sulfuricaulis sp.]
MTGPKPAFYPITPNRTGSGRIFLTPVSLPHPWLTYIKIPRRGSGTMPPGAHTDAGFPAELSMILNRQGAKNAKFFILEN